MAEDLKAGLIVTDLVPGAGAEVQNGDEISIVFRGWVLNADRELREITLTADQARHRFRVGQRAVIEGWDLGVLGMKPGGSRRIVVPPDLGYRALGLEAAGIPGGATLVFEITLAAED